MPYKTNSDLPKSVINSLPNHAQDIYREAFNKAWKQYEDPKTRSENITQEVMSHMVAWAAVKKEYKKKNDRWIKKK